MPSRSIWILLTALLVAASLTIVGCGGGGGGGGGGATGGSTVSGTLTDRYTGDPVGGATVQLWQAGVMVAETTSLEDGTFSLANIPDGTYNLEITASGYETYDAGLTTPHDPLDIQLTGSGPPPPPDFD